MAHKGGEAKIGEHWPARGGVGEATRKKDVLALEVAAVGDACRYTRGVWSEWGVVDGVTYQGVVTRGGEGVHSVVCQRGGGSGEWRVVMHIP